MSKPNANRNPFHSRRFHTFPHALLPFPKDTPFHLTLDAETVDRFRYELQIDLCGDLQAAVAKMQGGEKALRAVTWLLVADQAGRRGISQKQFFDRLCPKQLALVRGIVARLLIDARRLNYQRSPNVRYLDGF